MTTIRMLALALFACALCVIVNKLDSSPRRDLIGSPVACTANFPFRGIQAEILEYGLKDVRGLACDRSGQNIFISEGERSLLVYSTQSSSILRSKRLICPGGTCDVTDRRGLAFVPPSLYVAEHGRGQIMVRSFGSSSADPSAVDPDTLLGLSQPLPGTPGSIIAPSGVALADRTLFITDDGTPNGPGRPSGVLYSCPSENCAPLPIAKELEHPTGVAASTADGPVYVVETNSKQVRWPIFINTKDRGWVRKGALGSVAAANASLPPFLGIAIDDARSMIFAAGPGGLYIFGRNGRNSGHILFDDQVTGVASCGNHVYLAVGHMLCRLTIPKTEPDSRQSSQ